MGVEFRVYTPFGVTDNVIRRPFNSPDVIIDNELFRDTSNQGKSFITCVLYNTAYILPLSTKVLDQIDTGVERE